MDLLANVAKKKLHFPIRGLGGSQAVLESNNNLSDLLMDDKAVVSTKADGYRDWSLEQDAGQLGIEQLRNLW